LNRTIALGEVQKVKVLKGVVAAPIKNTIMGSDKKPEEKNEDVAAPINNVLLGSDNKSEEKKEDELFKNDEGKKKEALVD